MRITSYQKKEQNNLKLENQKLKEKAKEKENEIKAFKEDTNIYETNYKDLLKKQKEDKKQHSAELKAVTSVAENQINDAKKKIDQLENQLLIKEKELESLKKITKQVRSLMEGQL